MQYISYQRSIGQRAFALPTILIASVVMIIVMLAGMQAVVSVNIELGGQYYDRLAREAALAGVMKAKACANLNGSVPTWTDASQLRPNTTCAGGSSCTGSANCFVAYTTDVRSTFASGTPTTLPDGSHQVLVTSTVERLRAADGAVWKTYTSTLRIFIPTLTATIPLTSFGGGQQSWCAIASSGDGYCVGSNSEYMLGNGQSTNYNTSTLVPIEGALYGESLSLVDAQALHSCAIAATGIAYCWGTDHQGALGNAAGGNQQTPAPVYAGGVLSGKTMSFISTAGTADVSSGTVYAHTCALDSDGYAYCWGSNGNSTTGGGQVGDGTYTNRQEPVAVLGGYQYTKVDGGSWHTCAIRTNGKLYCWGADNNGQIGNGIQQPGSVYVVHTTSPTPVVSDPADVALTAEYNAKTFTQLSTGQAHNCAIATDGTMWCWGQNTQGQLGDGTSNNSKHWVTKTSFPVGVTGWSKVAAGTYWTCALSTGGKAYCWGACEAINGPAPYLGDGNSGNHPCTPTPNPVDTSGVLSGKTLTNIWANWQVVIVRDSTGKYYTWGTNNRGQLGTGTNSGQAFSPVDATHFNGFITPNDGTVIY